MASSDTLSLFSTIPRRVQSAIDDAFDISVNPNQTDSAPRPSKRRKISVEPSGGGFVAETGSNSSGDFQAAPECGKDTQIPLDVIPSALQRLDLPADDEDVLSVFRNAASGWASSNPQTAPNLEKRYVSRDDWRAVCAVLLENRPLEDDQGRPDDDDEFDVEYSDEYDKSEGISSAASEDEDEYLGERSIPSSRRRKSKSRQAVSFDDLNGQAHNLTWRQKQTCLDTFALFFPHISASELENQRIMIKDLQGITKLLNEKLKADQMLEMLEMFSTSPDKSMGFEDFSCMMMTAKLA